MSYHYPTNPRPCTTLYLSMTYLLILTNYLVSILRALSSGNNSVLAFILFVYSSFFSLEYCFLLYHQLPQNDNSLQKKLLAVAIWCLFTGVMFGVAHQFAMHMYLVFDIILHAVAFIASAIIFYVYIIYDNKPCVDSCCTGEKVKFSQKYVDIILEKV